MQETNRLLEQRNFKTLIVESVDLTGTGISKYQLNPGGTENEVFFNLEKPKGHIMGFNYNCDEKTMMVGDEPKAYTPESFNLDPNKLNSIFSQVCKTMGFNV